MKPAWRLSSRAIMPISALMSGFSTFFLISLYSTQPENSLVTLLTRKSRNSLRSSGLMRLKFCFSSTSNSASRWKWS